MQQLLFSYASFQYDIYIYMYVSNNTCTRSFILWIWALSDVVLGILCLTHESCWLLILSIKLTVYQITKFQSTFPPMLAMGSPVRHHIVTYIHVKLKPPHTSDSILVNPDPEEVGAATWLDRNLIQGIVHAHDPTAPHTTQPSKLPEIIKYIF